VGAPEGDAPLSKKRKQLLLRDLAVALNACEKAGIRPKLKHGIVFTDAGYVMPVKDKWVSRSLKRKLFDFIS
jgi:hypothetical protein